MLLKVWMFVRGILPTKKIAAWILGVIGALVALVMGVANSDLKQAFCEAGLVQLPAIKIEAPPAPAADGAISVPAAEKK